jgi:hypothetical protein
MVFLGADPRSAGGRARARAAAGAAAGRADPPTAGVAIYGWTAAAFVSR